jgi:hypothetical protein
VQFEFEQTIGAPPGEIVDAYCDPAFYEALGATPELGRPQLLERAEEDGVVRLRVRFAFTGEVSPAVRAVVDPQRLSWVAETTVRPAAGTIDFVVVPDHYPDRLTASGADRFLPEGDGTRRVTRGQVRVRVPLLGRSAERGIVGGYRRHLAAEAAVLEEWLVP